MLPDGKTTGAAPNAEFQACLEQAEICCEQARLAAHRRRYEATYGLFSTAIALYQQAITMAGASCASRAAIVEQVRHIQIESSAYSELARSRARPLLTRHGGAGQGADERRSRQEANS